MGWSLSSYYFNKTAPTATYEALGSTKNCFVKSSLFKTGEKHNTNLNCSKHYQYYYIYYHYLPVLSKSVNRAAMEEKFRINSL